MRCRLFSEFCRFRPLAPFLGRLLGVSRSPLLCNQSLSFGNACGNSLSGTLRHTRARLKLLEEVRLAELPSNARKELRTRLTGQSPLASPSRSHADRKFSYHVSVKLVMTCSAVCPAIFTPEWTISPQVCTRVPFLACSSKLTHSAKTTPRACSIHPTFCPLFQFLIT